MDRKSNKSAKKPRTVFTTCKIVLIRSTIGDNGGKIKSKARLTPSRIAVTPSTAAMTPYITALPTLPCFAASLAAIAFFANDTILVPIEMALPTKGANRMAFFATFSPNFLAKLFLILFPTNSPTFFIPLAIPKLP